MDRVDSKILSFYRKYKTKNYRKGEIIIKAMDDPPGVFYLKRGIVKVYTISKKGEEIILNIYKPRSFFPVSWAINKTLNPFYYEALSDTITYLAPTKDVLDFLKSNPDVLFDLTSRVYRGLDGLLLRLSYLMAEKATDRLLVELIINAKRYGRCYKNDKNKYFIKVKEKDLAAQSGLTRETISREIGTLRDRGYLEFSRNKMTIIDIKKLEDLLVS